MFGSIRDLNRTKQSQIEEYIYMLNARVTEIFSKIRRSVLINKIRAEVDECRRAAFDKIFYHPV